MPWQFWQRGILGVRSCRCRPTVHFAEIQLLCLNSQSYLWVALETGAVDGTYVTGEYTTRHVLRVTVASAITGA